MKSEYLKICKNNLNYFDYIKAKSKFKGEKQFDYGKLKQYKNKTNEKNKMDLL